MSLNRAMEFDARNNGGKRQRTEIIASRVEFLGAPPTEEAATPTTEEPTSTVDEASF